MGPSPRTLRFREHSLTALIDTHFPQSGVTWCQAACSTPQCRHCYSRGLKRKMAAHKSLNTPISWPGPGKRVFVFLQGLGAGKCAKLLISEGQVNIKEDFKPGSCTINQNTDIFLFTIVSSGVDRIAVSEVFTLDAVCVNTSADCKVSPYLLIRNCWGGGILLTIISPPCYRY